MIDTPSRYRITRTDKLVLAYGAFCGATLVFFLSRSILLAVLLGIPPAVFTFAVVLIVHKRLGMTMTSPPHVTLSQRRVVFLVVLATAVVACGKAAWLGNGFELLILLMTFVPGVCLFWFNMHAAI